MESCHAIVPFACNKIPTTFSAGWRAQSRRENQQHDWQTVSASPLAGRFRRRNVITLNSRECLFESEILPRDVFGWFFLVHVSRSPRPVPRDASLARSSLATTFGDCRSMIYCTACESWNRFPRDGRLAGSRSNHGQPSNACRESLPVFSFSRRGVGAGIWSLNSRHPCGLSLIWSAFAAATAVKSRPADITESAAQNTAQWLSDDLKIEVIKPTTEQRQNTRPIMNPLVTDARTPYFS